MVGLGPVGGGVSLEAAAGGVAARSGTGDADAVGLAAAAID